jgi:hypothetical protein
MAVLVVVGEGLHEVIALARRRHRPAKEVLVMPIFDAGGHQGTRHRPVRMTVDRGTELLAGG